MKTLIANREQLRAANRWDIDYHLPAEGIKSFSKDLLMRVDQVAEISRSKRDPKKNLEEAFQYIDISSVDVEIGEIKNPQTLEGIEAPSRARKVVSAFDIIISTCRPTRGAIAVVPPWLHDQIASTGFSVIRPKPGINPFYLHYALRLESTLEQFRKWSTGSSYPAILDSDVKKTLIPVPSQVEQDDIARIVNNSFLKRKKEIQYANEKYQNSLDEIISELTGVDLNKKSSEEEYESEIPTDTYSIEKMINSLKPITVDMTRREQQELGIA